MNLSEFKNTVEIEQIPSKLAPINFVRLGMYSNDHDHRNECCLDFMKMQKLIVKMIERYNDPDAIKFVEEL